MPDPRVSFKVHVLCLRVKNKMCSARKRRARERPPRVKRLKPSLYVRALFPLCACPLLVPCMVGGNSQPSQPETPITNHVEDPFSGPYTLLRESIIIIPGLCRRMTVAVVGLVCSDQLS